MKISVIVPTYNESGHIIAFIEALISEIKKSGNTPEIVVVDDSSPDGTGKLVTRYAQKHREVKAIVRKERGLATALKRGITESSGDILVFLDSDFSHPPKDIPRLIRAAENADAVFASRYVKGGKMYGPKIQYALSWLFNVIIKIVLGIPIIDSTGGFFIIRRNVLTELPLDRIFTGYGDYCFKLIYALKGKRLREIPFIYQPRRSGKSKTPNLAITGLSYWKQALLLRLK